MLQLIQNLLFPTQYMPHGHCYLWQTPLVSLHVASDFLIEIAYFSIPAMLIYFIIKRRDVPFLAIFALFGAFIVLCGTGHLLDIWTLWHPAYWLSGAEQAITAIVSCFTAGQMITLLPQFLSLKTPQELEEINIKLQREILIRQEAELALRQAYDNLELKVQERTLELQETNLRLEAEIKERIAAESALREREIRLTKQQSGLLELAKSDRIYAGNIDTALTDITQIATHTLDIAQSSIWLYNEDKSTLCCLNLYELHNQQHQSGRELAVADYPAYFRALHTEKAIVAIDPHHDPRTQELQQSYLIPFNISSLLDIPITHQGKIIGVICLEHKHHPKNWTLDEQNFANYLAQMTTLAMESQERKLAEKALQKAVIAADSANRAKSEFLASMSHELRTPLNAILGFSQVMVRDLSLKPQHLQHLEIINRAGEHLLSLINDILEMSKIESGRTQLNKSSFNLTRLIQTLEEMFCLKAEAKKLALKFQIDPNIPQFVKGDESKLRQILINLLGNAIKFTDTGSVILRLKTRKELHPSTTQIPLYFEVEDTGAGIAAKEMDKLFKPFEQTNTGIKSQQGTGLGLPISQKFVQMMGGDIHVVSHPGIGSKFAFEIDMSLADPTEVEMLKPHRKVLALEPNQPEYRILVVDDRPDNCLVMERLLSPLGLLVREAKNGAEAITIWQEWQPHLIWMDMQMPVMNGYETTRKIKSHPLGKQTIIIALTASAFEEERQKILDAGCDDFIRKPFEAKILFSKMESFLGVRYIYEEPEASISTYFTPLLEEKPHQSVASELLQMPIDWLHNLVEAASQCSDDKILALVDKIPEELNSTRAMITDLANNFLFDDIVNLVRSSTNEL